MSGIVRYPPPPPPLTADQRRGLRELAGVEPVVVPTPHGFTVRERPLLVLAAPARRTT